MTKLIVFTDLHMVPEGMTIIGLDPYQRLLAGRSDYRNAAFDPTDIGALNLMSNIVGIVVLAVGGHVVWVLAGIMAVGQFVSGRMGSHAAMRFGPRLIRPLLVVISLAMTARLLSDPANPLRAMIAGWLG